MTPSEKVSLGRALEELERPKAKAAQQASGPASVAKREGRDDGFVPPNGTVKKRYDVREDVDELSTAVDSFDSLVR